jgi:hypothetical protein
MNPLPDAALRYARQGIAVFPLRVREKAPHRQTAGLLDAVSNEATVAGWWSGVFWPEGGAWLRAQPHREIHGPRRPVRVSPASNIGIATGEPAGFWVLDMDGPEGAASLAALEARHGVLPATVEQRTGAGRHLCFALPADGRAIRNSASKVGDKIDVRGDGGYIVAPPSIHPSGRAYAWRDGYSPWQIDFAQAPAWLLDLAARPATTKPAKPAVRQADAGRASRYGEAALSGACGDIVATPPGGQNTRFYEKCVSIGALVAGGAIERGYAFDALVLAGLSMATSKAPWTQKQLADIAERAFTWAEAHPRHAPEREAPGDRDIDWEAGRKKADGESAAVALWSAARPARQAQVLNWFARLGLDPDALPGALEGFRAHAAAPVANGVRTPCLLAPMRLHPDDRVETVALFDLSRPSSRAAAILGPQTPPRAVLLTNMSPPGPVVVAVDFADAWALAAHAARKGERIRAVATLTLGGFAGQARADKWGRVNTDTPTADPDKRPWLLPAALFGPEPTEIAFAMRHDLVTPPMRARKFQGGTEKFRLEGPQAVRWYGALAAQAWKRLEASSSEDGDGPRLVTRLLTPKGVACFHHQLRGSVDLVREEGAA